MRILLSCDEPGHPTGYHVVAKVLCDAGFEAVLGGAQEPEEIAFTAIQEDVDAIGYRIMCGEPTMLVPRLQEVLKLLDAEDIPIIVGGIIPPRQVAELKADGVKDVFLPGARPEAMIKAFNQYRRIVNSVA